MPKQRKTNKADKNKPQATAWRTPVKLPQTGVDPMKSLYSLAGNVQPIEPEIEIQKKSSAGEGENSNKLAADKNETAVKPKSLRKTNVKSESKRNSVRAKAKSDNGEKTMKDEPLTAEINSTAERRLSVNDFLRLLKSERMDFYSLQEILRGSSMALYCVLYAESRGKGESRCQIRQGELMMRAGINNPATLYKQERWLTALGLISKTLRLGNHNGASYEVRPLETLPLPDYILDQFGGYLAKFTG